MSNSHLYMKNGFLRLPLKNGIGRYVCQLQRIVFKFCKNQGGSRGLREFIENDVINYAKENPGVVVYLKPRRHRDPIIIGEYLNGERKWMSCRNMSREEVARWATVLLGFSGAGDIRYRKPWSTDYPSIQGPWTPFNSYPNKQHEPVPSKAYGQLLKIAKDQGIPVDKFENMRL